MTQLSGQIHSSAGDAVDDISAIHGSLSAIQDVIHGTGSDFNTDTSAAADQVYDAVQTINGAMSGLLDEVDRLTRRASADLDEVGNQLTALRKGLKNLTGTLEDSLSDTGDSLSSTLDALEREHSGLVSELRQIADETDRLESFVKDALQAAARLDLAGILDAISAGMWFHRFQRAPQPHQRPSGGHGFRHVPLGGPSDSAVARGRR